MQTVGAFQAKTHFSSLLEQVEKGEEIIITKHGHPVAKIIPMSAASYETVLQSIQKIKELRANLTLGDLDWKELRDEGRR